MWLFFVWQQNYFKGFVNNKKNREKLQLYPFICSLSKRSTWYVIFSSLQPQKKKEMQTLFNYSNTNKNRNTHCEQKTVTNNLSKENVKKTNKPSIICFVFHGDSSPLKKISISLLAWLLLSYNNCQLNVACEGMLMDCLSRWSVTSFTTFSDPL